jgi:predicted transcriptional regulator
MGTSSPTELATEVVASFVSNNPLPNTQLWRGSQRSKIARRPKSSRRRLQFQFEDRSRRNS